MKRSTQLEKRTQADAAGRPGPAWRRLLPAALLLIAAAAASADAAGPGVHGRVFALDENGAIAGAVPGARIELAGQGGGAVTVNAAQGGYYRADLPPGSYRYKVTAEGFRDEDFGSGFSLQLGEGYAVYNFSLTRGQNDPDREPPQNLETAIGKLAGRVLEKKPDGQLVGIERARITLRRDGGGRDLLRAISRGPGKNPDQTGFYQIVLEPGVYRASVAAEGFEPLVASQPISIAPEGTTSRDFILSRQTPDEPQEQGIRGRITLFGRPGDEQSPPAVNVQIIPLSEPQADEGPIAPGPNGRYQRELAEGRYRVLAQAEGYQPAGSGPREVFAGRFTTVNLRLAAKSPSEDPGQTHPPIEPLVFHGAVYEELPGGRGKRPLVGASVLVRAAGQALGEAPRGETGQSGTVDLAVAAPGTYTVLARKTGYQPAGGMVAIAPDGENSKNILLVKLERQTPIDPVTPPAQDQRAPGVVVVPPRVEPVSTLPPIRQTEVTRPDWGRTEMPDRVPVFPLPRPRPVEPSVVTLNLLVAGTQFHGRQSLMMPGITAVAGAQIKVLQGGRLAAAGQSDGAGRFEARLEPGAYQLYVAHPGFFPHEEAVALSGVGASRRIVLRGRVEGSQPSDQRTNVPQPVLPDMRRWIQPEPQPRQAWPPTRFEQLPPARTHQSPLIEHFQQMGRGTNPAAAAQLQQHGQAPAASGNRLSFDPRHVRPPMTFQTPPASHVPAGQGEPADVAGEKSRLEAIQRLIRARQATVK